MYLENNTIADTVNQPSEKVRWFLSLPILAILLIIIPPFSTVVGIVLLVVRFRAVKNMPKKLKATKLFAISLPLTVIFIIGLAFYISYTESKPIDDIKSFITAGDYISAKAIIDEQLSSGNTNPRFHLAYADYYEAQQDYDSAANVLTQYFNKQSNKASINSDIEKRLNELRSKVSDSTKLAIDNVFATIATEQEAIAKKKAEEQAKKETTDKEKLDAGSKAIEEIAEQVKEDSKSNTENDAQASSATTNPNDEVNSENSIKLNSPPDTSVPVVEPETQKPKLEKVANNNINNFTQKYDDGTTAQKNNFLKENLGITIEWRAKISDVYNDCILLTTKDMYGDITVLAFVDESEKSKLLTLNTEQYISFRGIVEDVNVGRGWIVTQAIILNDFEITEASMRLDENKNSYGTWTCVSNGEKILINKYFSGEKPYALLSVNKEQEYYSYGDGDYIEISVGFQRYILVVNRSAKTMKAYKYNSGAGGYFSDEFEEYTLN